jgi:hypothetical protein
MISLLCTRHQIQSSSLLFLYPHTHSPFQRIQLRALKQLEQKKSSSSHFARTIFFFSLIPVRKTTRHCEIEKMNRISVICFLLATLTCLSFGQKASESDHVIKTSKNTSGRPEACGGCHLEACESPTLCVAG